MVFEIIAAVVAGVVFWTASANFYVGRWKRLNPRAGFSNIHRYRSAMSDAYFVGYVFGPFAVIGQEFQLQGQREENKDE